jgi:hypothetical protein
LAVQPPQGPRRYPHTRAPRTFPPHSHHLLGGILGCTLHPPTLYESSARLRPELFYDYVWKCTGAKCTESKSNKGGRPNSHRATRTRLRWVRQQRLRCPRRARWTHRHDRTGKGQGPKLCGTTVPDGAPAKPRYLFLQRGKQREQLVQAPGSRRHGHRQSSTIVAAMALRWRSRNYSVRGVGASTRRRLLERLLIAR